MHRVVKPFPVSWDGLTLVDLVAGDERDFGDMTAGLVAEGYIEPIADARPPVAAEPALDSTAKEPVDEPAARRGRPRKQ